MIDSKDKESLSLLQKGMYNRKLKNIVKVCELLKEFNAWITPTQWDARFDIKMSLFLAQASDANMRVFMEMPTSEDSKLKHSGGISTKMKVNTEAKNSSVIAADDENLM